MAEHAGQIIRRREDPRLVTGRGQFVDDLDVPGCLHLAVMRSPHAHARIVAIDGSAALRAPGVVAVVTAADIADANAPLPTFAPHPALTPQGIRALAIDRVRYVGEPVAAVVADSSYHAWDALDLVRVDYEPLPAVAELGAAAAPGAPLVHEALGSNIAADWRQRAGDPDRVFAEAPVVVRTVLRLCRGGAQPLEPRGLVATWDGSRLTVKAAIQMVHRHKRMFAGQLGLPEDRVRVIAPSDVGGGFGTKGPYYPEDPLVAALAIKLNRPVKWIETRREHTLASYVEREQLHRVEIAATREGEIVALRDDFLHEMGAYTVSGFNLAQNTMIHSVGAYRIPHLDLRVRGVLTHTTPCGAYRGAGRPQGAAVIERAVDALARELRVDRIEVRQRNLIPAGSFPYVTGLSTAGRGPINYDSGDYPRCMAEALDALDLKRLRDEQERLRAEGRYLGIGLVNYVEATGSAPHESAIVRVDSEGRISVCTGAAPQGQAHETMFSQLVGELMGVEPMTVEVRTGDSDLLPEGGGTFGSRTTALGGGVALLAGRVVREKALRIAAHLLEAAPADVVLEHGQFFVRGLPTRAVSWAQVAEAAHAGRVPGESPGLEDYQLFTVQQSTFANGTHAAVVEVDPDTGALKILRWVVAHDCGHVFSPTLVDGQVHGGVVQGIPDALNQQLAYDESGQRLTGTLMEYALATASDAPPVFDIRHLESPTPLNPMGAKGAGEGGIMPVHPVLAQAVEDALAPFGVVITHVPFTRADVWKQVRAARG